MSSSLGIFLNFVWALLLVLGLAYVALRVLARVGILRKSPAKFLEQLDYLPLGPKRGIALIQVVDRTLAVGVSDAGVTLLAEISPDAIKASIRNSPTGLTGLSSVTGFREEFWKRIRGQEDDGRG